MGTKEKYKEKGMTERGRESERDKEGVRGRGGRIREQ